MNKEELIKIVKESRSKTEVCKKIGLHTNGKGFKEFEMLISQYNIDITHFDRGNGKKRKYELITKECPVCKKEFKASKNQPKEKQTCSYACSNTYFRSGESHPNWKESSYRSTCFLYHEKKCVICGEDKILDVHHYDENHKNNSPENLIPLCPTHHVYWHSRFKNLVKDKIDDYVKKFILKK